MKILFNLMNVGLGNNGGSHTLVRSANTLVELGCDVTIIDTGKVIYSWTPLLAKHKKIRHNNDLPDADAVIGTGFSTFRKTLKLPDRCGRKFIWIRGWETWNTTEDKFINSISNPDITKLVNSQWLLNKLIELNIKSFLIRPGYDFNEIYPMNIRRDDQIILGGLYNQGAKRKTKRTFWISKTYESLKKKHKNLKLYMFGSDGRPNFHTDKFIFNPDMKQKNELYNQCHIWLAPTELEGLHICPAEAMQTECIVVGTKAPKNGMQDYLIPNKTGVISENNINSFIESVDNTIQNMPVQFGKQARQHIKTIGDRKQNMNRLIKIIHYGTE